MLFSQRQGYTAVKDIVQHESMDKDLRVAIWNVMDSTVWSSVRYDAIGDSGMYPLTARLWAGYFKRPFDTIPARWSHVRTRLREHVFEGTWYDVYDFLEFVVNDESQDGNYLAGLLNGVLEAELAAYRFVGGRVTAITAPEELAAVEDALVATDAIPGAGTHLRTALELLADRESPDYRNSIKESISAVEAVANHLAGTSHKSLGAAMKAMTLDVHGALDEAFRKLYGYTSDAEGIRHALMDEPSLKFEDAMFMLVTCSAFVNYLIAKAGQSTD